MHGRETLEDVGVVKAARPGKVGNKSKDQAESGLKRRGRTVCNSGESDGQDAPTALWNEADGRQGEAARTWRFVNVFPSTTDAPGAPSTTARSEVTCVKSEGRARASRQDGETGI